MVWYGMVWYGMVWYGMLVYIWYGMVWYGMVCLVWYGKVGTAAGFSKSDCQGAGDPSSLSDFSGMRHIIVNGWQIVRL